MISNNYQQQSPTFKAFVLDYRPEMVDGVVINKIEKNISNVMQEFRSPEEVGKAFDTFDRIHQMTEEREGVDFVALSPYGTDGIMGIITLNGKQVNRQITGSYIDDIKGTYKEVEALVEKIVKKLPTKGDNAAKPNTAKLGQYGKVFRRESDIDQYKPVK